MTTTTKSKTKNELAKLPKSDKNQSSEAKQKKSDDDKKIIASKKISSSPKIDIKNAKETNDKNVKKEKDNIFPIGKFVFDEKEASNNIKKYISDIEELPDLLKSVAKKIDKKNKNNSYRDGGWTVEQIIHHIADSHMNAYLRFKLALTEGNPTIKPYSQDLFAETAEVFASDLKSSIRILKGLHHRWTILIKNMSEVDYKNYYIHPEYKKQYTLLHALALYAWHGKHHVAQIKVALKNG